VIHPEKYLDDERPVAIDPKAIDAYLAAQGYARVWATTLGELGTSIVAETHLKGDVSAVGAGWGGDALVYYENGDKRGLVAWGTAWDTEADAIEFQAACFKLLPSLASDDKAVKLALRKGASVGVLLNLPAALQDAAVEALWKCETRRGGRTEPLGTE
jgi:hypothetical protein